MQTQSAMTLLPRSERKWWRDAVTYQIYIRSFADANGDGKGDVEGIRSRLPYLKSWASMQFGLHLGIHRHKTITVMTFPITWISKPIMEL